MIFKAISKRKERETNIVLRDYYMVDAGLRDYSS